jgi:putative transposase
MPFWRTYYHLVWATQERAPLIRPEIEAQLFAYLVRKASELGVFVYAINGMADHVHLIVSIPPHHSVAEVVKLLKGASSHDLKLAGLLDSGFAWQRGYGVLTLGERQKKDAEAYVVNQKTHHQQASTHAWLEYETAADEGPGVVAKRSEGHNKVIGEEVATYTIDDAIF